MVRSGSRESAKAPPRWTPAPNIGSELSLSTRAAHEDHSHIDSEGAEPNGSPANPRLERPLAYSAPEEAAIQMIETCTSPRNPADRVDGNREKDGSAAHLQSDWPQSRATTRREPGLPVTTSSLRLITSIPSTADQPRAETLENWRS